MTLAPAIFSLLVRTEIPSPQNLEEVCPAITEDTYEEAVKEGLEDIGHDIATMIDDPPLDP